MEKLNVRTLDYTVIRLGTNVCRSIYSNFGLMSSVFFCLALFNPPTATPDNSRVPAHDRLAAQTYGNPPPWPGRYSARTFADSGRRVETSSTAPAPSVDVPAGRHGSPSED